MYSALQHSETCFNCHSLLGNDLLPHLVHHALNNPVFCVLSKIIGFSLNSLLHQATAPSCVGLSNDKYLFNEVKSLSGNNFSYSEIVRGGSFLLSIVLLLPIRGSVVVVIMFSATFS